MDNAAQQMANSSYIFAQSCCAMIEAMGMQSENQLNKHRGEQPTFLARDFEDIVQKYSIYHNATVIELFRH